jgi:hypothetical protein
MNKEPNYDPSAYDDPNLETQFFQVGELMKRFDEKYAQELGSRTLSTLHIADVELSE